MYYNYIVVNVMGNILRLAGRVSLILYKRVVIGNYIKCLIFWISFISIQNLNDEGSYNIADVFDNIGRASYSIGFTTDEAYNIHPEVVPTCILSPITGIYFEN